MAGQDLDEYGMSRTRPWSTSLMECGSIGDIGIAGFVAFCEPCAIGLLARSLPPGSHPLAERPALAAAVYTLGVGCCVCGHGPGSYQGPLHYAMRMQLRRTLQIRGDPWQDLVLTTLCPKLALCQEIREASRCEDLLGALSIGGDPTVVLPSRSRMSISTPSHMQTAQSARLLALQHPPLQVLHRLDESDSSLKDC